MYKSSLRLIEAKKKKLIKKKKDNCFTSSSTLHRACDTMKNKSELVTKHTYDILFRVYAVDLNFR